MPIEVFSHMPWFLKGFLLFAVPYLVVLICYSVLLQRDSPSDRHDLWSMFTFVRKFAIVRRTMTSDFWLMRFCSWYLMICMPIAYLIWPLVIYFGVFTLDMGASVVSGLERAAGIPSSQMELQARYDQRPADDSASTRLQSILLRTRDSNRRDLYRSLVSGGNRPVIATRLSASEKQQLRDSVAPQRDVVVELVELARLEPVLKNPITFQGMDTELRHLAAIQNAAHLLVLSVLDDFADPEPGADPVATLRASFMLARSFENEPILMSKVVQYVVLSATVEGIELVLNNANLLPTQLNRLRTELEAALTQTSLEPAMMGEQVLGITMFDLKGADLRDLAMKRQPAMADSVDWNIVDRRWQRARNADKMNFLQTMRSIREQLGRPYPQRLSLFSSHQSVVDTALAKERLISTVAIPDYEDAILREANAQAFLRCAQLAVAIRQYEAAKIVRVDDLSVLVPEYLATVPTDPFGGGGSVSHKTIPGWHLVHSVGINRQGESGILANRQFKLAGDDPGVYVASTLAP